jgi:hypothetical protein
MGEKKFSSDMMEQIKKDVMIRDNHWRGVQSVEWHFYRSANTGKIGPDARLLAELRRNRITPVIHE